MKTTFRIESSCQLRAIGVRVETCLDGRTPSVLRGTFTPDADGLPAIGSMVGSRA